MRHNKIQSESHNREISCFNSSSKLEDGMECKEKKKLNITKLYIEEWKLIQKLNHQMNSEGWILV